MKYPLFSQKNKAWKNLKIPGTALTIERYGCVVCDIAMLAKYCNHLETPASILPKLKFTNGLFHWHSITNVYPGIKLREATSSMVATKIQAHLQSGRIAIGKVNISTIRGQFVEHWIVFWAMRGNNNYEVSDPAKNITGSFNHLYLRDKKIYKAIIYDIPKREKEAKQKARKENPNCAKQLLLFKDKINRIRRIVQ